MAKYFVDGAIAQQPILGTNNEFLASKLAESWSKFRQNLQSGQKIESVTAMNGAGIQPPKAKATVHRVIFTFSTKDTLSVVIKMPYADEVYCHGTAEQRAEILRKRAQIHDTEANFYRWCFEVFSGFPLPTIYYASKYSDSDNATRTAPPMLIMQDLTEIAHEFQGILAENSEKALKNIVVHLANFHAHIMCLNSDDWKTGFPKGPMFGFDAQHLAYWENNLQSLGDTENVRRLEKTLQRGFVQFALREFPLQMGISEVLVHGDLHQLNVMLSNAVPDSVQAFVDFGSVFVGSPMFDIERIVSVSTTKETRPTTESAMLELYVQVLGQQMRDAGRAISFNLDQIKRAYQLCKVVSALQMMSTYAVAYSLMPNQNEAKGALEEYTVTCMKEAINILEQFPEWLLG